MGAMAPPTLTHSRSDNSDFASPLALKLQQVWLQTQLHKKSSTGSSSSSSISSGDSVSIVDTHRKAESSPDFVQSGTSIDVITHLETDSSSDFAHLKTDTHLKTENSSSDFTHLGTDTHVETDNFTDFAPDILFSFPSTADAQLGESIPKENTDPDLEYLFNELMNEQNEDSNKEAEISNTSAILSLEQELMNLIKPDDNKQEVGGFVKGVEDRQQFEYYEYENDEDDDDEGDVDEYTSQPEMKCTISRSLLDSPEEWDDSFGQENYDETDANSDLIQPKAAWMTDSPVGLVWPNTSARLGSYHHVLQSLGLQDLTLIEQVVETARAVSLNDVAKANKLVDKVRSQASPLGTSTQRIAHYFVEALVARMSSTGNGLFTAMCHARPTAGAMLRSVEYIMERSPLLSVRYFFPNQVILKACKGHSRIHIVDYGSTLGFQWPALMQELAKTPGGPPYLRITGIDSPLPGGGTASDVGCMLREYARSICLPFKFRAVSRRWESIDASTLKLRDDEALFVNCMFRQTNLLDESVLAESPRKVWLNKVRSLNPKIFTQGVNNASYNVPFFMTRFLEALTHFAILFDAIDCCSQPESVERHLLEQEKYGREIVNIVACEGLERVERAETYKQWHSRTQRANFELLDIDPEVFKDTESLMSMYHQDFGLQKDHGWLLLGWKGQILHAFSAWRPRP